MLNSTFNQERTQHFGPVTQRQQVTESKFCYKAEDSLRSEKKYVHEPTGITTIACMHNRDQKHTCTCILTTIGILYYSKEHQWALIMLALSLLLLLH